MAVGKEIRTKIKSIKNTQKITKAMEMVAASKMRKAQERMMSSRPYATHIRVVVDHLAKSDPEYVHPFMMPREIKAIGFIIISTDRGLCGGLNINMFRKALSLIEDYQKQGFEVSLCLFGAKAESFFARIKGAKIVAVSKRLGDAPTSAELIGPVSVMLNEFRDGQVDEVYLLNNAFVNTMTQKPSIERLVPVKSIHVSEEEKRGRNWDYLYEPDPKSLLDFLITRFIESQVYQGMVENFACEQAARMVAMKSASDNAGDFIGQLQLAYNKARQAAITQELAEICSGANAV